MSSKRVSHTELFFQPDPFPFLCAPPIGKIVFYRHRWMRLYTAAIAYCLVQSNACAHLTITILITNWTDVRGICSRSVLNRTHRVFSFIKNKKRNTTPTSMIHHRSRTRTKVLAGSCCQLNARKSHPHLLSHATPGIPLAPDPRA